jgi:hypothetical protein
MANRQMQPDGIADARYADRALQNFARAIQPVIRARVQN